MRWNDRIGRRIKLSDLHIFLAVAQNGSMAKAADALAMSHPVVSRSIGDLEHALGVQLLERNRRGVTLTEYGRAILSRSHAAFDELRQGVLDIEFISDPTAGVVRVGTTPPLGASFVFAVVDRLGRQYPQIVFEVLGEGGMALQQQNLIERRVDLLIYRKWRAFPENELRFEHLFESPYVVAAGAKNPWSERRRLKLSALINEKWALPQPRDSEFGQFVLDAFRAGGLAFPHATVTAEGIELRANLLRTGRYLSIIPEFWLQFPEPHPFIGKLPVELPVTGGPIGIITLKNRTPSPVAALCGSRDRSAP
jgi:DNA-binding transcriptional LysR family regulator